jgi:hypothetical protein
MVYYLYTVCTPEDRHGLAIVSYLHTMLIATPTRGYAGRVSQLGPGFDMGRKRAKKVTATGEVAKPIRLELLPQDHERLEAQARKRGLNKAATARMVILEWLEEQEKKK